MTTIGIALALAMFGEGASTPGDEAPPPGRLAEGRELFFREWTPGDPRSTRGDGLGPVFNDSSCVACHNAGGPGGGGPSSKNVDIVTAVFNGPTPAVNPPQAADQARPYLASAALSLLGIDPDRFAGGAKANKSARPDTSKLIEAHPGFRTARSVVLHKASIDPGYEAWRGMMTGLNAGRKVSIELPPELRAEAEIKRLRNMTQVEVNPMRAQVQIGEFELVQSRRNPTALFGIGRIDAIPDSAIEAMEKAQRLHSPESAGRVARQKDGRIGRFGWKAQVPTLDDFVLTACAVELGLEVPGHKQAGLPKPSLKMASESVCKVELTVDPAVAGQAVPAAKLAPLDLTSEQCAALESYVRAFPSPAELNRADKEVQAGRVLFDKVGCASCHAPSLGGVDGIYSDMLVHDLGQDLGDTGSYTPFIPGSEDPEFLDPPLAAEVASGLPPTADAKAPTGPATRVEWRTPPLWGVRDSSPYLHDGRAPTLERAIALHGGQGTKSVKAYFTLTARERLQVESFLKSLAAPDATSSYAAR